MPDASTNTRWNTVRFGSRLLVLCVGLALAGCQTDGGTASSASRTLSFESIDGPPKPTFDKLVTRLSAEAGAQQVAVVSRTDKAAYRVRGYLAVHSDKATTSVAYAWDVFDADKQRVARITGEEVTKRVKGDAWAVCDEAVLAKIAGKSMASLAETLGVSASGQVSAGLPAAPSQTAAPSQAAAPVTADPAPAAAPAAPAGAPIGTDGPPIAQAEPQDAPQPTTTLAFAQH
ncbi:MAG: hypothetical protein B7Y65_02440 [Azorhizobium sp. 35-67-15]|jgi:hypothetical protein|nr:MAG: hypothetical protein B7Y65_02440 [Azorhizobium sp. 35-67-15]